MVATTATATGKSADGAVPGAGAGAVTIPSGCGPSSSSSSPAPCSSNNYKTKSSQSSQSPPYNNSNSTAATILQHRRKTYGSSSGDDDDDNVDGSNSNHHRMLLYDTSQPPAHRRHHVRSIGSLRWLVVRRTCAAAVLGVWLVLWIQGRRPPLSPQLLRPATTPRSAALHTSRNNIVPINNKLQLPLSMEPQIWKQRQAHPDPDSALEDVDRGAFRLVDSLVCRNQKQHRDHSCAIYFPSYDPEHPTTCWPAAGTATAATSASSSSLCMMTLRGAKGHDAPNQDRSVVLQHSVQSFDDDNANNNNSNNNNDWTMLAALFDGHGDLGHVASQIAIHELPLHLAAAAQIIKSNSNSKSNSNILQQEVQQLFTSAYLELDNGSMAHIPRAGTTAVTVLQQGHRVHLASAGDSTAVLVQWLGGGGVQRDPRPWYYRQWLSFLDRRSNTPTATTTAAGQRRPPYQILARAVQHKPGDPRERARIEAAGGVVHIPFDAAQTSRVVYPVHDDATGFTMQMALAMSRSLGDRDGKQLGVVIADPDVVTVDLNDHITVDHHQGFFVVLASDGVADMVPIEDVIVSLGMALYNEGEDDLHTAVQDILTTSVERWGAATGHMYRDDMSLILQTIELPSGER